MSLRQLRALPLFPGVSEAFSCVPAWAGSLITVTLMAPDALSARAAACR